MVLPAAEAMSFVKKSKTLAVAPKHPEDARLVDSKTHRATERAARAQQRELRKAADNFQDTEASQALLHLAHGQAEPAAYHDNPPAGTSNCIACLPVHARSACTWNAAGLITLLQLLHATESSFNRAVVLVVTTSCAWQSHCLLWDSNHVSMRRGALAAILQGSSSIEHMPQHDNAGADCGWEGSQSTSSEADKMFAAAWVAAAGPARLAADWRSGAATPVQPASTEDAPATGQEPVMGQAPNTAHQPAAQLADLAVASPLHTKRKSCAPAAQPPVPASSPSNGAAEQLPEVPSPASKPSKPAASSQSARSDHRQAAAGGKVKPDIASSPSPQPYVKPVTRAQSKTPQSGQKLVPRALLQSPAGPQKSAMISPAEQDGKAGSPKQSNKPAPATPKRAAGPAKRSSVDPAQASVQGDSSAARQREQEQSASLEERALQLATQVQQCLMDFPVVMPRWNSTA